MVGTPGASAGRIDTNPAAVGPTTVTLRITPVAPSGTTTIVPDLVAIVPVTLRSWGTGDTNGPGRPMSSRVSRMRVGVTLTNVDSSALTAADACQADNDHAAATVTAMPIAKYRKGRTRSVCMEDLPRSRRARRGAWMSGPTYLRVVSRRRQDVDR